MSPALLVFALLALAALVSGLGSVTSRSVVYSALFLLGALVAVAGFFILLLAEFLGLAQLLLYGGTVVVLIFFVLMLTRQEEGERVDNPWRWGAAVAALLFFALYTFAVLTTPWPAEDPELISIGELGRSLFADWVLPFEIASVLLLVALIGAIIIARARD